MKVDVGSFNWDTHIKKVINAWNRAHKKNTPLPVVYVGGQVKGVQTFFNALVGVRLAQYLGFPVEYVGDPDYREMFLILLNEKPDIIAAQAQEMYEDFVSCIVNQDVEEAMFLAWEIKLKYRKEVGWAILDNTQYVVPHKRSDYTFRGALKDGSFRIVRKFFGEREIYRMGKSFGQDLLLVGYYWFLELVDKVGLPQAMLELKRTFPQVDFRLRDLGDSFVWEARDKLSGTLLKREFFAKRSRETLENFLDISKQKVLADEYLVLRTIGYSGHYKKLEELFEDIFSRPIVVYSGYFPKDLKGNTALVKGEYSKWYVVAEIPYGENEHKLVIFEADPLLLRDNKLRITVILRGFHGPKGWKYVVPIPKTEQDKLEWLWCPKEK